MTSIAYAVIADARAIQRRRRLRIGAFVALALVTVAIAVLAVGRHRDGAAVTVRVVLPPSASPVETHRLLGVVQHEPGVTAVSVTSAAAGFAQLRAKYPLLVSHLTSNPLSATFQVKLRSRADAAKLRKRLAGRFVRIDPR